LISASRFADLFERQNVLPVDGYTTERRSSGSSYLPHGVERASSC
jgi:hypothetical protein